MSRPHLLLVPFFTELEWGTRHLLEEWAEVASFDMPGVGSEPLPEGLLPLDPVGTEEQLRRWREAGAERGVAKVDACGWESFFVVADTQGAATAVRIAGMRDSAVRGLALGHAALSHATEGERPPLRREIWEALGHLLARTASRSSATGSPR